MNLNFASSSDGAPTPFAILLISQASISWLNDNAQENIKLKSTPFDTFKLFILEWLNFVAIKNIL